MAITTTDLKGTDSISASRITINDNVATISEALNDILSIVDIGTGRIDNSSYSSLNNIKTTSIEVTGNSGISVNTGPLNILAGNIVISIGSLTFANVGINEATQDTFPVLNVTGASALQLPVGATWTATGATGMILYVPGSGAKVFNGVTWDSL
jgi:hypothetical protein